MDLDAKMNIVEMMSSYVSFTHRYTDRTFLINDHEEFLESPIIRSNKFSVQTTHSFGLRSQPISNCNVDFRPENRVRIIDLKNSTNKAIEGKFFLCRSLVQPFKMTALGTIVDDPEGQYAVRLALYNFTQAYSSHDLLSVLPVGTVLAIKNPWFKSTADGAYGVRCDNPADIIFINEELYSKLFPDLQWKSEIPTKYKKVVVSQVSNLNTRDELKKLGNDFFNKRNYIEALKAYSRGLDISGYDTDLLSNRCATYLNLEKYNDALNDADAVMKIEPLHAKVILRKVRALCGLKEYKRALKFLTKKCEQKFNNLDQKFLNDLKTKMQQQLEGTYDMSYFLRNTSKRFLDCVEFIGNVEVNNSSNKGRGLFATENIQAGQLILACKAFAIVFPEDIPEEQGHLSIDMSLQSGGIYLPHHRKLVFEVEHRLISRPELGKEFYNLYAGPQLNYIEGGKGYDCGAVDINRINQICRHNSFGENMEGTNFLLQKYKASGLWLLPSYVNHSCISNSTWRMCGDFLFIRAWNDISKGEEVLISYIAATKSLEKRLKVFQSFGFQCDCELCKLDKEESSEVHIERKRILDDIDGVPKNEMLTQDQINRLETAIAQLKKLRLGHPMFNFHVINPQVTIAADYFGSGDYIKSAEVLEEIFSLIDSSPIGKDIQVNTAINLMAAYIGANQLEKARKWSKILKRNLVKTFGSTASMEMVGIGKFTLDEMKKNRIYI